LKPTETKQQRFILLGQSFFEKYGSIVGTLVNVGLNKITLDDFNAIIVHKNRDKGEFQHMVCI
jgi:hypothetical protein